MMKYRWEEIDRLAELLEAEAAGESFDQDLARDLAERLTELCPDIALTMSRVVDRFSPPPNAAAA
jgi:hypothetical protein